MGERSRRQPPKLGAVLTLDILVQPRASRAGVGPMIGDRLRVAVTAPPVEGEANDEVIQALAEAFDVRRADVEIVRGMASRRKTVRVAGADGVALARVLAKSRMN